MLGFIKSVGSKAISSIPGFNSRTKITTPEDANLEQKLKQISSQILKTQTTQQFKIYQQLQSVQNADFNRNLRKIYEHEGCMTETINCIIRFYTFLLTNCKNQLVICKLVSEPLVIQLTKIVLQINQSKQQDEQQLQTADCLQNLQAPKLSHQQDNIPDPLYNIKAKQLSIAESQDSQQNNADQVMKNCQDKKAQTSMNSLHYLNDIDWDEVNAYKVALIRSYINCINPQTIKYMIIDSELPIFVNCVNGYKHYLSEGVEGTCLSNCILMILTKVNHNDQVCEIIFDSDHHYKTSSIKIKIDSSDQNRQKLSKSISNQKSIKLHVFVKEVIKKISVQLSNVLQNLGSQLEKTQDNFVERSLKEFRKLDISMQFIESNILFCVDLINSINNYNYTAKIKQNIGESIEKQLIGKIIIYVQTQSRQEKQNTSTPFQLTILKLIRFVLNLSITCQKQLMIIQFLNKKSPIILATLIQLNKTVFDIQEAQPVGQANAQKIILPESRPTQIFSKQCLTYLCNYAVILLKQTISPYSKLASRKRLEIGHQILQLKQNILSKIFILLEQITKSQQLKQGICFKAIRNLLLCVFYLTIKQDKCTISTSSPQRKQINSLRNNISADKSKLSIENKDLSLEKQNLGLILEFKYSILLLHKIYCEQFKKIFTDNKNWQYIVNNYEALMRQVPNTILSAEQNDKYCHYHNGHNYQEQDKMRDRIMICEAVRNYRYMIIHETKLQNKMIRLQNIYHKHFMSPGWNYYPGEIIQFNSSEEYKVICVGLLHNNNQHKLPIEIIQDFQCLLISHKVSQHNYKLIANIRYKKIHSFVPQGKNLIRMKLIGIQQLILEFSTTKVMTVFKEYLNENRNKTRQKQLKFINYYLNMYLKDSSKLIEEIYNQQLVGLENEEQNVSENIDSDLKPQQSQAATSKKLSFDNIETESFQLIQVDSIPEQNTNHSNGPIKCQQSDQADKDKELHVNNDAQILEQNQIEQLTQHKGISSSIENKQFIQSQNDTIQT